MTHPIESLDYETLQKLDASTLAEILFFYLRKRFDLEPFIAYNLMIDVSEPYGRNREHAHRLWSESFNIVEQQGLIARMPGPGQDSHFITRRGETVKMRDDFKSFTLGSLLPEPLLNLLIATEVKPLFLQGKYDTAVFEAFHLLEIEVRKGAKYEPEEIGVQMMRKAFAEGGPLADPSLPVAEQKAMEHLFAGAMGFYKNAASHRKPKIVNAEQAALQILMANELLNIATERAVGIYFGVDRPPEETRA